MQPRGRVFAEEDPKGKSRMRALSKHVGTAAGAILFAIIILALLSLPGLLSDRDSTVPSHDMSGNRP
jgi:hypothetical protein